ncbi:DUF5317 family protein, partial [Bacillus coreaensis]
MKYILILAILLTLLKGRNPLTFINNVKFQWPLVILISFGVQIALAIIAIESKEKFESILIYTFIGIIVGLIINYKIPGVIWIVAGAILNLLALLLNEGLMPVDENALKQTGQEVTSFETDSRHQLMTETTKFWILGDWIPVIKYVLSPGDLFVAIGIILLIYKNSSKIKTKVRKN